MAFKILFLGKTINELKQLNKEIPQQYISQIKGDLQYFFNKKCWGNDEFQKLFEENRKIYSLTLKKAIIDQGNLDV